MDLLKKNGFDNDVIEDAIKMCNKIKEKNLIFFKEDKKEKNKKDKVRVFRKLPQLSVSPPETGSLRMISGEPLGVAKPFMYKKYFNYYFLI